MTTHPARHDLVEALKAVTASLDHLTDRDVTYWGSEIRIDAGEHWKAIHEVRIARQAVARGRAALTSEAASQVPADGWQMVPTEATKEMREAIHTVRQGAHNAALAYRKLLLAAPTPAAPDQEGPADGK